MSAERNQDDAASTASSATLPQSDMLLTTSSDSSLVLPPHMPWAVEDLELFHHYMTAVAIDEHDAHLWRNQIPRLAFRRHGLLHLILSIAAVHLARQDAARSVRLLERAELHMNIGLRSATLAFENLNEQNCVELYFATILVCTYSFARPPGPGNLLVVAEGHEVAWWELFRGVRLVVETIGLEKIHATLEKEAVADTFPSFQGGTSARPTQDHIILGAVDWEAEIGSLSSLVDQISEERKDSYQKALDMLKWCFQDTFVTSANRKPTADARFQTIMAWLYVLEDDYVDMLKRKEPIALVLLAHFAVLFHTLETVWFLKGWAPHILQGVSNALRDSSQAHWLGWLRWPTAQVERGMRFVQNVQLARTLRQAFGSVQGSEAI